MIALVMRLLDKRGDDLASSFRAARRFWRKFFKDKRDWTVEQFAEWFGMHQASFGRLFDDRDWPFAKEVFGLTMVASLYDETGGWEETADLALRAIKGLLRSTASLEVKLHAKHAAKLFYLDEKDDELREMCERWTPTG
jgi:hypothetical protein